MADIYSAVEMILDGRRRVPAHESMLVAMSGIDASGKGYVAERIVTCIQQKGINAVAVNVDGWLNLPPRRFHKQRPAEHFYRHAIRFDDMFERLILPLKRQRSIRVEADLAEETATDYHRHVYDFRDVDVIVLEGIYLLKRAFRQHYDLAFWVECSVETALVRALRRGQEGLPPDDTIRAYQTICFPAQYIHLALDDPRSAAHGIIDNDRPPMGVEPAAWHDVRPLLAPPLQLSTARPRQTMPDLLLDPKGMSARRSSARGAVASASEMRYGVSMCPASTCSAVSPPRLQNTWEEVACSPAARGSQSMV